MATATTRGWLGTICDEMADLTASMAPGPFGAIYSPMAELAAVAATHNLCLTLLRPMALDATPKADVIGPFALSWRRRGDDRRRLVDGRRRRSTRAPLRAQVLATKDVLLHLWLGIGRHVVTLVLVQERLAWVDLDGSWRWWRSVYLKRVRRRDVLAVLASAVAGHLNTIKVGALALNVSVVSVASMSASDACWRMATCKKALSLEGTAQRSIS